VPGFFAEEDRIVKVENNARISLEQSGLIGELPLQQVAIQERSIVQSGGVDVTESSQPTA
jgi:hypothetical protein